MESGQAPHDRGATAPGRSSMPSHSSRAPARAAQRDPHAPARALAAGYGDGKGAAVAGDQRRRPTPLGQPMLASTRPGRVRLRNSTYSMMSDTEVAGFKRVVGSFVEASSFGYWTLGYFAFATSLWLSGIAMRLTLVLSVLSFLALLFSTSTTAYVGMSGYLFVEFVIVAVNFLFGRVRPQMLIFLICVPIGLALVVVAICINDASYAYVANLLDELVLNKMSTGSGIERSTWNNQAIQNFLDTFGFGVGNGSVRASSFPVAVIASLGFLGAATYASFLLAIWFRKAKPVPPIISATQRAGRSACLAWLIAASASGSFIDLGLPFFAFAALACAECVGVRTRSASAMRTELLYRRDVSTALD